MSEIINHKVGDVSDIKLIRPQLPDLPATLDGSWSCKTRVLNPDGSEAIAEKTITSKYTDADGQEWFMAAIEPSDSALLAVIGDYVDYRWYIQVENATTTPPYKREKDYTLRTYSQGVTS